MHVVACCGAYCTHDSRESTGISPPKDIMSIHTRKITVTVPQSVTLDDLEEMFDNIAALTLDAVND